MSQLVAVAAMQLAFPVIGLMAWSPAAYSWAPDVMPALALNAGFAVLFARSALLFKNAAEKRA